MAVGRRTETVAKSKVLEGCSVDGNVLNRVFAAGSEESRTRVVSVVS